MKHLREPILAMAIIGCVVIFWFANGIRRATTTRQVVALTFDDGPNPPHTEQLLKILAEKKVKVTFFLIGKQLERYPDTARKIISGGHELGGHSYGWKSLAFKRRKAVEEQLDHMNQAFENVGITNLILFRPPGGLLSPWQGRILKERGLLHVSADVVAGDWKDIAAETIRERVLGKVRRGSIIVLHDGGGDRSATIAAVPEIIDWLRGQGYYFVTVSELLELK